MAPKAKGSQAGATASVRATERVRAIVRDAAAKAAERSGATGGGGLWRVGLWAQQPTGEADDPWLSDATDGPQAVAPTWKRAKPGAVRIKERRGERQVISAHPYTGRYVGAAAAQGCWRDLAWDAMLRARCRRRDQSGTALVSCADDVLKKVRRRRPGRLLLFAVDISGSMGESLIELARYLALKVLEHAYVKRDRVAMIAFRAHAARVILEPTNQVLQVHRALQQLPLGSTTPLAAGLQLAGRLLRHSSRTDPHGRQRLVLISDGRANVGSRPGFEAMEAEIDNAARLLRAREGLRALFFDTTAGGKQDRAARRLAQNLGAPRIRLCRLPWTESEPLAAVLELLRAF